MIQLGLRVCSERMQRSGLLVDREPHRAFAFGEEEVLDVYTAESPATTPCTKLHRLYSQL